MITLKDFLMNRDKEFPLSNEQALNAADLLARVNYLLAKLGIKTVVTSGYRPGSYNAKAGGAQKSAHLTCQAVDLRDSSGVIASVLKNNIKLLEECDLYLENPDKTLNWIHLQSRRTSSGNRVFNP
jgi:uncharacterized protein YcbK (DUF882 family)